ncbi:uncharacterized protein LOC108739398 isoform X2 [Agrilus planipennis]|nr:uncharacterized protein LOC108739398 isoform X2 [Agrilus planipennis]XP_018328788.1 uncharacterized protein LOC108739398 isoform X2 [Agrilus planipennis]
MKVKVAKKIYLCPSMASDSCLWEGDSTEVLHHFEESHGEFLLESPSFVADVSKDNSQNYILHHHNNVFLLQTEYTKDEFKLTIRLRFLGSKEHANKIKYTIEVISGNFSFTNSHCHTGYNPVITNPSSGSVEVDVQGIMLICGRYNFGKLQCCVHIEDNWGEEDELRSRFERLRQSGSYTDESTDDDRSSVYSENLNETFNSHGFLQREDAIDEDSACELHESNSSSKVETSDSSNDDSESLLKKELTTDCSQPDEDDDESNAFNVMTNDEKLEQLKCSNCHNYMIPPIYLCLSGHGVCHNCMLFDCRVCQDFVTKNRNETLEVLSTTVNFPCRYSRNGCFAILGYSKIRIHEHNCTFCPYTCNICGFEGQVTEIRSHFRIAHPSLKVYESGDSYPFPNGSDFVVIDLNNGVFHCTASMFNSIMDWKVVFCGSTDRQFSCEVKVFGKRSTNHQIYFLEREENVYRMTVSQETLRSTGVKEKYARLYITKFW